MININNNWQEILSDIEDTESFKKLEHFLTKEYSSETIFPPKEDIWKAFEWTPFDKVKVVILGQDPYHGENQAHGLSFSVLPGEKIPPSLRNIYKELESDLSLSPVNHGYLRSWAQEGVLMLNTVLTVRAHMAHSHKKQGWEEVTDFAIKALNNSDHPIVFILWGNHAQNKKVLIDTNKHFIIESSHPSPLSARHSFFGSKPFSRTNELLIESGQEPINWKLEHLTI